MERKYVVGALAIATLGFCAGCSSRGVNLREANELYARLNETDIFYDRSFEKYLDGNGDGFLSSDEMNYDCE